MPYIFRNYSDSYPKLFEDVKGKIQKLSSDKLEIEHIGSMAVKGLGGKGIIDVSIGIRNWGQDKEILKILKKIGFRHFYSIERGDLFVSTRKLCGEGDYHVHISRIGTKKYARTIAFRDFLSQNLFEAKKYQEAKKMIFKKCGGDRKLYKRLKNKYFLNLNY